MANTKESPQRTTLILDPELHKRLRMLAIERGKTFTALVTDALQEYLERQSRKERRPRR
jgi:predicted transcriptional regulator